MNKRSGFRGSHPVLAVLLITAILFITTTITACERRQAPDPSPTSVTIAKAAANMDWPMHGLTAGESRHSDLADINTDTVSELAVAWFTDIPSRSLRGVEATPIVVDGIMYVTGPWSVVMAIDARNGDTLWHYDPEVPGATARKACCDMVNRGVAVSDGKVISATLDGRLIALDKRSGELLWSTLTVDQTKSYTITGAPRIVGEYVVIGNGGSEYGVRGYVSAYDIDTGEQVWRFFTVPGNPEDGFENAAMAKAAETWTGQWWQYGGGGTAWDSMAYDADLDLLYVGVGNGSPWNQAVRSPQGGDNLFISSIVALRPKTGEYVWHFQTTPGDQWDYTATQHMILADIDIEGATRKVIMQAPKNGYFYVLDRETGEFISGKNFVPVNWSRGLDPKTGRPDIVAEAKYSLTGEAFLGMPSPGGGHNWQPMSYNSHTSLVYFSAMDMPYSYVALSPQNFRFNPSGWNTGEDPSQFPMPEDPQIRAQIRTMLKGKLLAWDPVKQQEAWSVPMGVPWNGGTLTTSGNLVFHGNGEGYFAAYRADNGEKVWEQYLSSGIVASPITYAIDDEQYVAIAVGWGGIMPLNLGEPMKSGVPPLVNRIVSFKLGGEAVLPIVEKPVPILEPPASTADALTIAKGRVTYHEACWMCHGDGAVNNGGVPNLRTSPVLGNADAFALFVLGGIAETNGMPNFAGELTEVDVENIRAYVINRAQVLKADPALP
ncbi:MAG: PQQ-dependent dehydrogenase, methanol/ethanol family [Pseudomonadota bacterium]